MLEMLTFDVVLGSPYERLYHILRDCGSGSEVIGKKTMRDAAWSFLNDSALTTLCLLQTPQDIAIAALYWAIQTTNEVIPDFEDGTPWWKKYDAKKERVSQAIDIMCRLYSENPLQQKSNPYDRSPESDEIDFEKTRSVGGGSDYTPNGDSMRRTESQQYDSPNGFQGTPSNGDGKERNGDGDKGFDGENDAGLKKAANDPATHENTANGSLNGTVDPKSEGHRLDAEAKREEKLGDEPMVGADDIAGSSAKRKEISDEALADVEREVKRAKIEENEQSEEGEVEE